jgi:large subunit ribosomal protein L5
MAKTHTNLKQNYIETIAPKLFKEFNKTSVMAVPKLTKIVINAGVGKAVTRDAGYLDEAVNDIGLIAGQKPVVTKSKLAISNFKLREGMDVGVKVTLRGQRMWDFFDKLVNVVLPRVRDFKGVSDKAFDRKGNYALGMNDHTVFPEIDTSKMIKIKPLQIIICTSAGNDDEARVLLKELGMPFKKRN